VKLKPIGKCIYCFSTTNLSDEHVIAYSLNANVILPKASCGRCRDITSRIENDVSRGLAWQMRTALGFPTRHSKNVPATFPLGIVKGGIEKIINVPVSNHPIIMPIPLFEMPVYFDNHILKKNRGFEEGIGLKGIQILWFRDLEKILKEYNADNIFIVQKVDHIAFARMIAKIAYCLAVAEYGLDGIAEAFVLPAILGNRSDIGQWVGSSEQVLPENPNTAHTSQVQSFKNPASQNLDGIILVFVRLFSNIPSPVYITIVGRPS
jgi:hypothetical protein